MMNKLKERVNRVFFEHYSTAITDKCSYELITLIGNAKLEEYDLILSQKDEQILELQLMVIARDERIKAIRTATRDEDMAAVKSVIVEGGLFPKTPVRIRRECIEAIDNLRGKDEQ
jgi:hypothetical protein